MTWTAALVFVRADLRRYAMAESGQTFPNNWTKWSAVASEIQCSARKKAIFSSPSVTDCDRAFDFDTNRRQTSLCSRRINQFAVDSGLAVAFQVIGTSILEL